MLRDLLIARWDVWDAYDAWDNGFLKFAFGASRWNLATPSARSFAQDLAAPSARSFAQDLAKHLQGALRIEFLMR